MGKKKDNYEFMPAYSSYDLRLNGNQVTLTQREHFFHCLRIIDASPARFIYRGENRQSLQRQYGAGLIRNNDNKLKGWEARAYNQQFSDRLFVLGQKGRYFNRAGGAKGQVIQLADECNHPFELLFRMLHELFKTRYTDGLGRRMKEFREREAQLYNYFMDMDNLGHFIGAITALSSGAQVRVRDYYLGLLHNMDRSRFYSQSFLLSTTTNLQVAEGFAGIKEDMGFEDAVILSGWVPAAFEGVLMAPDNTLLQRYTNMADSGLPLFHKLIYYDQEEVALKGGFLPHYLLGYHFWENGQIIMEVNPALFEVEEGWIGEGLPVWQGDFDKMLRQTIFGRCFSVDEFTGKYRVGRSLREVDVQERTC